MENIMMNIARKSVITGKTRTRTIHADPEDMKLYNGGQISINEAMPYLTPQDRDFVLAGITANEWNNLFSSEIQSIVNDKMGS